MAYSISYRVGTKPGRQSSASATSALRDHATLLLTHAYRIVVRDERNHVVSLRDLIAQKKLDGRYFYQNDGNSD
jgi:hypothetical protein